MTTASFAGKADADPDDDAPAPSSGKAEPVVCASCGERPYDGGDTSLPPAGEHATPCIWCGADPRG